MTITRSLVLLLSLVLCLAVLAQRTHHNLDQAYEAGVMVDVYDHVMDAASDCDVGDIGLVHAAVPGTQIPRIKECARLNEFYRQLVISPPSKPPLA